MTAATQPSVRSTKRRDRSREVLDFISAYIRDNGYSPSYDEIRDALGLQSKGSVAAILRKLVDDGKIVHTPRLSRTIRLA